MGHLSRSLESCVSSFKSQDSHILTGAGDSLFSPKILFDDNRRGFVLDDFPGFFLLFCVGFCERMVTIIKDKIEFSSEMFLFQKVGKPGNIVSKLYFPKVGKPGSVVSWPCFLKVDKPGNNVCYSLLLESGQTRNNCFR